VPVPTDDLDTSDRVQVGEGDAFVTLVDRCACIGKDGHLEAVPQHVSGGREDAHLGRGSRKRKLDEAELVERGRKGSPSNAEYAPSGTPARLLQALPLERDHHPCRRGRGG
jgi:hypothetical protein